MRDVGFLVQGSREGYVAVIGFAIEGSSGVGKRVMWCGLGKERQVLGSVSRAVMSRFGIELFI